MRKTEPVFPLSGDGIPVPLLRRYLNGRVLEGEIRGFSDRTLWERRYYVQLILWFLESHTLDC